MFIYFDMGNVLLFFDHEAACRQMAEVASTESKRVDSGEVRKVLFDEGLELEYEAGKISTDEFYQRFCQAIGTRPDFDRLVFAASDIFQANLSIKPLIGALQHARYRLGLLSNTNEMHWKFVCDGRFGFLPDAFETLALSFEIGAIKPDPSIFIRAAELAGVAPQEVFFVDDRPEHVAAAREVGFDAVVYSDTPSLAADLRQRGIRLNY